MSRVVVVSIGFPAASYSSMVQSLRYGSPASRTPLPSTSSNFRPQISPGSTSSNVRAKARSIESLRPSGSWYGRLLWAVDHVWDSTAKDTQEAVRAFYSDQVAHGRSDFQWQLAAVSPRAFQRYVAWETARTLPSPNGGGRSAER